MSEDEFSHILVIENTEGDYYVKHPSCCPTSRASGMFDDLEETIGWYYTCRVQAVLDGNGLDDIENWKDLAPGEYEIKSYYEYHPGEFGGSIGADHEIAIFLVEKK